MTKTATTAYTSADWNRDYDAGYAEAVQRFSNQGTATVRAAHSRFAVRANTSANGGTVGYVVALADILASR